MKEVNKTRGGRVRFLSTLCVLLILTACGGESNTSNDALSEVDTLRRRPVKVRHLLALRHVLRSVLYASDRLELEAEDGGDSARLAANLYAEPESTFSFSEAEIFACPESGNLRYAVAGQSTKDFVEESLSFEAAGKIVFDDCAIPNSPYIYSGQFTHHRNSYTSADYRTITTESDGGVQTEECIVDLENLVRSRTIDGSSHNSTSSFSGAAYIYCFDSESTLRCDFDAERPIDPETDSFERFCHLEE